MSRRSAPTSLPSLVLLPGLDGTGVLFRPLLEALPQEVATIVVSYPGDTALGYSELLPIVLAGLPSDAPFVLVGESFSGPLAVMAAATHPPGLAGLVLCASFIRNPHPYIPSFLAAMVRPPLFHLFPQFWQAKALFGGYSSPRLRALMQDALSRVSPAVLACRVREVLRINVARQLAACTVPILYLRARRDFVVPPWNVSTIRRFCPQLKVVHLAAPHLALQVATGQAAEAITDFLHANVG